MRSRLLLSLTLPVLLASAACSPTTQHEGAAQTGARPGTGSLDLRDASATELVAQLALALGTPVTVDTEAVPLTRCARVTLVAPEGTPRTQLVVLARDVLRTAALSLDEREGHLVVARIPDADPPTDCPRIPRGRSGAQAPTDPLAGLSEITDPLATPPPTDPGAPIEGIRLVSESTYEVDPDAPIFEGAPESLMTSARILPHQTDGQVDGLRLYGIRRQSVLAALGLQNGDTVTTINGREVSGPDTALAAYSELRAAERIEVVVQRRGAPITLTYIRRSAARPRGGTARREGHGTPVP